MMHFRSMVEGFNDIIDDVLAEWAPVFIQKLEDSARKKTRKASGAARDSFVIKHNKSNAQHISNVLVQFNSYLRYQDMRHASFKGPPIDNLTEWVKSKGVKKFLKKHNRKYPNGIQVDKLANRIAWGIVHGKKKMKRRRWYNKERMKSIQSMYSELLEKIAEAYLLQNKKL